jgi:uncharacterized protein with FMN-binding domain
MIPLTAVPRPIRAGAALAGVAGMIVLAGCSTTDTNAGSAPDSGSSASNAPASTPAATSDGSGSASGAYADGTYTAEGSYATPESVETISVTVTLQDDVVTAVEVTGNPTKRESEEYQSKFIGGISDAVVGKQLDEVSVSRVAGSSLTSGGFNQAIQEIKAEAAA